MTGRRRVVLLLGDADYDALKRIAGHDDTSLGDVARRMVRNELRREFAGLLKLAAHDAEMPGDVARRLIHGRRQFRDEDRVELDGSGPPDSEIAPAG